MSPNFIRLVSTFFYIGYIPIAPGSMATLVSGLLCVVFQNNLFLYLCFFGVVTFLGFNVSGKMEDIQKQKDPSCVVIDEVAGSFVAFFMLPLSFPVFMTAFFLFRAFDMFKIYPINKLEELPGSAGIMLDDLAAGLYTNIVMQIAVYFLGRGTL